MRARERQFLYEVVRLREMLVAELLPVRRGRVHPEWCDAVEQGEEDDPHVVAVRGLPVPHVVLAVIKPERQDRVVRVPGQWVVELATWRESLQLLQDVKAHSHSATQRVHPARELVAHPLELQPREVPDLRDLSLVQVLINGLEEAHLEAVLFHHVDISLWHL